MIKANFRGRVRLVLLVLWLVCTGLSSMASAERQGWKRQPVNWRMTGGSQIRAIHYPVGKEPWLQTGRNRHIRAQTGSELSILEAAPSAQENTIDSPPIAGFVPWVAVAITNARSDELELDAIPRTGAIGNYLTATPQTNYGIGVFDTGASGHIISSTDAVKVGLTSHVPSMITSSMVDLMGVTGIVSAHVSMPLGLFIDGLGAIDPNNLTLNPGALVGETNVSIIVGDAIDSPLLPTAIGTPLSVYFAAVIQNDTQVTIVRDGNEFTGPDVWFFENDGPQIPDYPNKVPLRLRPTGSVSVQYFPNLFVDIFDPEWGSPMSPSVMTSFLPTQSLFFASGVDVTHGSWSAIDKQGFMLDTGAQVTVISKAIAARLSLDVTDPDFLVEIVDVTGESTMQPAFYVDSFEITATPQYLSYTNVPVVVIDVASPDGGTLEGIVGMNLFTEFNLVLVGGGLPDFGGHELRFERLPPRLAADLFPASGDGTVNIRDLAAFAQAWLSTPYSELWLPKADAAPQPAGDDFIDFSDFAFFAQQWLQSAPP